MFFKNIQKIVGAIIIITISSPIFADGSIVVYNNSLYKVNLVVTTQSEAQAAAKPPVNSYLQALFSAAPTNADGTLVMHPASQNYVAGSNVPMGVVSNVLFNDTAKDFNLQILDTAGNLIQQINIGTTLGTVVDTDSSRSVYIYSNVDSSGVTVPDSGGAVYVWDKDHSLDNPLVQTFSAGIIA